MIRLFAAVFPSDVAREHLVAALRPAHAVLDNQLRWTDPDNWHLTLAFYGQQPNDAAVARAHLTHAARAAEPMRLHLAGAGSFEGRTLWTGVGGDTRALTRLMANCVLPGADDPDDSDGLRVRRRAHLTVARATSRTRDRWLIDEHVRAHSVYQGPEFRVDHIDLVESHLGEGRSGGPRYEVVDRFELTGLGGC